MKKLFCVTFHGRRKPHSFEGAGQSPWFESKQKAQELCDELNEGKGKSYPYHIAKGPDHPLFVTNHH